MNNSIINDDYFQSQIIMFLNGELSFPQEEALRLWIEESEQNAAFFEDCRNIWLATTSGVGDVNINQKQAWERINHQIEISRRNEIPMGRTSWFNPYLQIAALVLIAFGLGFWSSGMLGNKNGRNKLCTISTPMGSRTDVVLPDGTHVWLNAGSKLTYDDSFDGNERNVSLEGEAFFKVKSNKEKPFVVHTLFMNVRAVGTSFNVKAYKNDKRAEATLVEGIIQVNNSAQSEGKFNYTLKPHQSLALVSKGQINEPNQSNGNEKGLVSEDKIEVNENIRPELYTSWKDNRWTIEGKSLGDLAVLFERRFNVNIHFKTDRIKQYKFSGTIENETVEQVFDILRLTMPIKYSLGKGEIWCDLDNELLGRYSGLLVK